MAKRKESPYEKALKMRAIQLGVHVEDLTDYQREEARALIPPAEEPEKEAKAEPGQPES